jgi:hypothetical protein
MDKFLMINKNYALTLLMLALLAQAAFATQNKNLFEELTCESKNLTIRPLMPEEYESAKTLDQSDHSFLELFYDDEDAPLDEENTANNTLNTLKKASTLLKAKTLSELSTVREEIPSGTLYFGVFTKATSNLAGVIKFKGFSSDWLDGEETTKHLLGTDVKFHKDTQGKGYASESYQTVFRHFTDLKLIPSSEQGHNDATFLGVHALIHLTNKASLKCLILNSGAKIGRLIGDRVEVYYPTVPTLQKEEEYLPLLDASLDKGIRPLFTNYLSRNTLQSEPAEKEIYEASFQKLLSVSPDNWEKALGDESGFLVRALAQFPHLFDSVPPPLLPTLNTLITQMEDTLPPRESIPSEILEKLDEMIKYLNKVREKLPRTVQEKSEEDPTKMTDPKETSAEAKETSPEGNSETNDKETVDLTTPEKQILGEDLKGL